MICILKQITLSEDQGNTMLEDLKTYQDRHKGRTCFLLGTGPSLRNLKPECIEKHIVIAVNSSILKAPKADYYFSCDTGLVLWKSWTTLRNLKCQLILGSNCGFGAFEDRIDGKVFDGIDQKRIHYIGRKSDDIYDKGNLLVHGSSSIHPALHLAYVMGCSPIVLIGCDLKYVNGLKRYHNFPDQSNEYLLKPEYAKYRRPLGPDNPGGETDGELTHHLKFWNKLNLKHIDIIDASNGSLTKFRKMTTEKAMEL